MYILHFPAPCNRNAGCLLLKELISQLLGECWRLIRMIPSKKPELKVDDSSGNRDLRVDDSSALTGGRDVRLSVSTCVYLVEQLRNVRPLEL